MICSLLITTLILILIISIPSIPVSTSHIPWFLYYLYRHDDCSVANGSEKEKRNTAVPLTLVSEPARPMPAQAELTIGRVT